VKRYFTEKEKERFSEWINDERKHPARFVNDMYITNFGWEESIRNYCFDLAKFEFHIDVDNTATDDTIDFISYIAYKLMLSISKTKKWKIANDIIEVGEKLTKKFNVMSDFNKI